MINGRETIISINGEIQGLVQYFKFEQTLGGYPEITIKQIVANANTKNIK